MKIEIEIPEDALPLFELVQESAAQNGLGVGEVLMGCAARDLERKTAEFQGDFTRN